MAGALGAWALNECDANCVLAMCRCCCRLTLCVCLAHGSGLACAELLGDGPDVAAVAAPSTATPAERQVCRAGQYHCVSLCVRFTSLQLYCTVTALHCTVLHSTLLAGVHAGHMTRSGHPQENSGAGYNNDSGYEEVVGRKSP